MNKEEEEKEQEALLLLTAEFATNLITQAARPSHALVASELVVLTVLGAFCPDLSTAEQALEIWLRHIRAKLPPVMEGAKGHSVTAAGRRGLN